MMQDFITARDACCTTIDIDLPLPNPEVIDPVEFDVMEPLLGYRQLDVGRKVVSLSKGNKSRTLHVVGNCWRIPGIHYSNYEFWDEGERGAYHALCKDCFRNEQGLIVDSSGSGSETSNSSDSSDSSNQDCICLKM